MAHPQGPNGQNMVPVPLSPREQKINMAFVVLERVEPKGDGEGEVVLLRNASAKVIREHIEAPIEEPKGLDGLWTPQIAKA